MLELSLSIKKNIVLKYFRLVQIGDLENLIDLFDDNVIIYEPFSKIKDGLKGKKNIISFLKVIIFSNQNTLYDIKFKSHDNDLISIFVRFKKNGYKDFTFNFRITSYNNTAKIKSLEIILE